MRYTLESVYRAKRGLECEVLLVDDGSDIPAEQELAGFEFGPDKIIRQENRGLLLARLRGLEKASGNYTLFLDADDLIGPRKLSDTVAAFTDPEVAVVYSDTARTCLEGAYADLKIEPDAPAPNANNLAELCIEVQPAPHSPIFRTEFLRELVARPLFPPLAAYNSVAEIWFYFNAAIRPEKVVRVPGAQTICGSHGGERITGCWEKMAVASLLVEEAFQRTCPVNNETEEARRLFGEKVFRSWRALPYDFSKEYQSRKLRLWRSSPHSRLSEVGHGKFQTLAKVFGAELAGRFLRRIQGNSYDSVRTLSRDVEIFHEAGQ